jgi:Holliday junction resolvase RusA-like endonuclease
MMIECPLEVVVGRKSVSLNLGVYRNLHYQVNNKAKLTFKSVVRPQIARLPILKRISIEYTLFMPTKRRVDVANICCVVDKFLCDALVLAGKLEDDNHNYLSRVTYTWGGVDTLRPRVEAVISEI